MFCKKCGAENLDNANFCISCGEKIIDNSNQQGTVQMQGQLNKSNFNKTPQRAIKPPIASGVLLIFSIIYLIIFIAVSVEGNNNKDFATDDMAGLVIFSIIASFVTSLISLILIIRQTKERKKEGLEIIIFIFAIVMAIISGMAMISIVPNFVLALILKDSAGSLNF